MNNLDLENLLFCKMAGLRDARKNTEHSSLRFVISTMYRMFGSVNELRRYCNRFQINLAIKSYGLLSHSL